MADEAGPSGAGTGAVPPEVLQEADRKFERGIQCIRSNDLEEAAQLFSEVLQVRTQHYGELAPECASAYYRYGATLLYQAQDSGDVFGAGVPAGEDDDEPEAAEGDKENSGDKGKAPATSAGGSAGGEGDEDEQEGEEAAAEGDLQLAWENLDTAKVIWGRDPAAHAQQLADVHGLLGDVAMESDDFETALVELEAALGHLVTVVQDDDRRIAELHFKRCTALQLSGDVEAALPAVEAALACLAKRRDVLAAKLAAPGEGDDAEQLKTEIEDVMALQEDLAERVQELNDLIAQKMSDKDMIKGALAPLLGGPAAAAAPVQNLGVVGRGTKRIKLQPVQANVPTVPAGGAAACAVPAGGAAACAAPGKPAAKKKRSLEDLMGGGGDGGETTIGFGSAPAAAPVQAEAAVKEAAGVPAFLQAASVQAVYSSAEKAAQQQ